MPKQVTKQVQILHISDLHFGERHRFQPPMSEGGKLVKDPKFPSLFDKLKPEFVDALKDDRPTILCVTGDITETANVREFKEAESFFGKVLKEFGARIPLQNVFVIPGNHDVKYDEADLGLRWNDWTNFYNRFYKPNSPVDRESPIDFVQLHLRPELGVAVLCLNSAMFVEKGTEDANRGRLGEEQLQKVDRLLKGVKGEEWKSAIKVALLHHHPVVIPALAEAGRGYDAVHNGGMLLSMLRRHGFHLILHGHKHLPTTFTEDTRNANQRTSDHVMLICAGGSAGSTEMPTVDKPTNTYNRIQVKWHPAAMHSRILVESKGLTRFDDDGSEILALNWQWQTLRVDDRVLADASMLPAAACMNMRKYDRAEDEPHNAERIKQYVVTRGNLAVAVVMPSFIPTQAYEARLWIVQKPDNEPPDPSSIPIEVEWRAGPKFEVITVRRDKDPTFSIRTNYWGPALFQARLKFDDGHEAYTYVFARIPESKLTAKE